MARELAISQGKKENSTQNRSDWKKEITIHPVLGKTHKPESVAGTSVKRNHSPAIIVRNLFWPLHPLLATSSQHPLEALLLWKRSLPSKLPSNYSGQRKTGQPASGPSASVPQCIPMPSSSCIFPVLWGICPEDLQGYSSWARELTQTTGIPLRRCQLSCPWPLTGGFLSCSLAAQEITALPPNLIVCLLRPRLGEEANMWMIPLLQGLAWVTA